MGVSNGSVGTRKPGAGDSKSISLAHILETVVFVWLFH